MSSSVGALEVTVAALFPEFINKVERNVQTDKPLATPTRDLNSYARFPCWYLFPIAACPNFLAPRCSISPSKLPWILLTL